MTLQERIDALVKLGDHLRAENDEFLEALQKRTEFNNRWFTLENQRSSVRAIANEFLVREKLETWLEPYLGYFEVKNATTGFTRKTIGLVLAGNIPLVGFHDVLSVFVSGHKSQVKLSEKDAFVLPYLLKKLGEYDKRANSYFEVVNKLGDFDAVIATGSNNSARYFEAYFGKYPHIIRRNRNGVAVLNGQETTEELLALGQDVFQYFGLGCRNVAKLYVPEDYDFQPLLEAFHEWRHLQNHPKYKNNFDYNYALLMLNKEPFQSNGAVIIREDEAMLSHIAGLYYETYSDTQLLEKILIERSEEIQLIVARPETLRLETKYFGEAQQPGLGDYADGVDTVAFLIGL
ncbi:acyl-CoA reductase [Lewinellaceae bacterium SD302]|nr:acyl-CoA reductase [Lewinellaceae bacterium SD302]